MPPTIYVDLRCLQDPAYRVRGIGHHVSALLRTRGQSGCAHWKTVGLIDPDADALNEECASLIDEVSASLNPVCTGTPAIFIDGAPMNYPSYLTRRFQSHPAFLSAAVVYDFIPLEWPGYIPSVADRAEYLAKMARLRNFDLFLPISEYTGWRLSELLGTPGHRIRVTGASARRSIYEFNDRLQATPLETGERFFLTFGAGDRRKNAEVVVRAIRRLNLIYSQRIRLKVVGHYDATYRGKLLEIAGHEKGAGFVDFCPDVDDEQLTALFRGAVATVIPSHIEGFSLPVVEASACSCPVIASTCAAHLELLDQPEALFPSHDAIALSERLEALLDDPTLRTNLAGAQAALSAKFREDAVGERFWAAIESLPGKHDLASKVVKRTKPRLAFLSPFPPDQSGVARYTALTMAAGGNLFESHLFSDASRPLAFEGNFTDAGPVSVAPLVSGSYEAVISVIGNSSFHYSTFKIFERYGGPCILHDARLIQIYFEYLGQQKFLELAAKFLDRPVGIEEVYNWIRSSNPASTFLEPVIQRASPLIVHTRTQQAEIKKRYGADAQITTSCPTLFFNEGELSTASKQVTRDKWGISADSFLIVTFGILGPEKGFDVCVLATELLRSWKIPAELRFVGSAGIYQKDIEQLADRYGIGQHVHCRTGFVDDESYREFLIAADAAIQLRTYGFGQLSAALTDCISAGLSSVASKDLAISCDAPEYVSVVPDQFSPLQVAEQLALIWESSRNGRKVHAEARAAYLKTHNFEFYSRRLTEILGLA